MEEEKSRGGCGNQTHPRLGMFGKNGFQGQKGGPGKKKKKEPAANFIRDLKRRPRKNPALRGEGENGGDLSLKKKGGQLEGVLNRSKGQVGRAGEGPLRGAGNGPGNGEGPPKKSG